MDLNGKVALITGGARIGRVVARALSDRGCRVAMLYRSTRPTDDGVFALRANLSKPAEAARVVKAVERRWGGVDVLVHMASVYEAASLSALQKNPELLQATVSIDMDAGYRLALRCAPLMDRRGGGRIVFFSDWLPASGRPRYKGMLPYYVAKAGVKGVTEALALELAPKVLVNAVAPGPILPPPDMGPAERREVEKATPLGRWGGPEEIAKAVLFFLESDFVTGETLRVDGGRHLQ